VIQSVQAFHGVVMDTLKVQQDELAALGFQASNITDELVSISGSETSTASVFRNQLQADDLVLRVQIRDTEYRIDALREYIRHNF
jgi:hypothetical protein